MTFSVPVHPCDRYFDELRRDCPSMREQGRRFEDFCRFYFKTDPRYATRYENVVTYAEWARQHDEDATDRGVDLVAKMSWQQ